MAYLTTFEAETSPITIDDLFKVNDYFGIKLFGNYWPQIKQAAAQIAQKAIDAPIMFYVRSFANENQPAGQSSTLGRALWGYNDRAGVELLGSATWGAVKNEMDELLGWNPFSTIKKAVTVPFKIGEAIGGALQNTNIPIISDIGKAGKGLAQIAQNVAAPTIAEKTVNLASGKGYMTSEEIAAAAAEAEKKANAYKSAYESGKRAGMAASEAAKAAAAAEKAAAAAASDIVTAVTPEGMNDTTKKLLLVGGLGLGAYLLLRKKRR